MFELTCSGTIFRVEQNRRKLKFLKYPIDGMEITSFDNLDDLFEQMRKDQEAADARVSPWQEEIKPGDYVARQGPVFMIYSEILEDLETRDAEVEHYRLTCSYSVACPNGELGDLHVSTIERMLTQNEFYELKEKDWR